MVVSNSKWISDLPYSIILLVRNEKTGTGLNLNQDGCDRNALFLVRVENVFSVNGLTDEIGQMKKYKVTMMVIHHNELQTVTKGCTSFCVNLQQGVQYSRMSMQNVCNGTEEETRLTC